MNEENTPRLPQAWRTEVFRALVEAQDGELSVAQSREMVSRRFDLSETEVRMIEREGLDRQWPPL